MDIQQMIMMAISAMLIQNIVLTNFLGLCSFFGVSAKKDSAIGMGLSVLFVITVSSIVTFLLYHYALVPNNLIFLRTLVFILVISGLVQILEMFIKKVSDSLYKSLGIYLPLITTNCAVLGVALLNIDNGFNFQEMIIFSVFTSLGYTFIIYVFAYIRERLDKAVFIPQTLKGIPIALLVAGFMAMAMMGFA